MKSCSRVSAGLVFDFLGGGKRKDEKLDQRRHDEDDTTFLVPQEGQQFLDDQGMDAVEHDSPQAFDGFSGREEKQHRSEQQQNKDVGQEQ